MEVTTEVPNIVDADAQDITLATSSGVRKSDKNSYRKAKEEAGNFNAGLIGARKEDYTPREFYSQEYLTQNQLLVLYEQFKTLDNTINLFFFSFTGLNRSSKLCGRLWLGVMAIRTILTNSMTHLVDDPTMLSRGFEVFRKEQTQVVRHAAAAIGRAVQLLVIFKKSTEKWRFLRKEFNTQLSKKIVDRTKRTGADKLVTTPGHSLFDIYDAWVEKEIKWCGMNNVQEVSFRRHLQLEEERRKKDLTYLQPLSTVGKHDRSYIETLDRMMSELKKLRNKCEAEGLLPAYDAYKAKMISNPKHKPEIFKNKKHIEMVKDNFMTLRIQMYIVRDVQGLKDLKPDENLGEYEGAEDNITEVKEFLISQLDSCNKMGVMNDDDKLWPHQKGIQDLGPFAVLELLKSRRFLKVNLKDNSYQIKQTKVKHMEIFDGKTGAVSAKKKLPYGKKDKSVKEALHIPPNAYYYSFFYPVEYGKLETTEEKQCLENAFQLAEDESPLHVLCLFGGFGYFTKGGTLISVSGVTLGDDIFFEGPYFIANEEGYKNIEEAGVTIAPVTLAHLKSCEATEFGWVSEYNVLEKAFAKEGKPFGNPDQKDDAFKGAFFYKYDNSGSAELENSDYCSGARRNYFQVLDFQELNLKKEDNANTPVLERLSFEVEQYRKEWEISGITRKSLLGKNLADLVFNSQGSQSTVLTYRKRINDRKVCAIQ